MRPMTIEQLLPLARSEFLEMPGLRLTAPQAARLWAIDMPTSQQVLDSLARLGFLAQSDTGAYSLPSRG